MAQLGVVVVVQRENSVLLTMREDFEVWCLPGGAVDPHETVAEAAVREVFEETGLRVELREFAGVVSKPFWTRGGSHGLIFVAHPLDETLNADPGEVVAVDFFPTDQLPTPLVWEHRQLIQMTRANTTGNVWVNRAQTPPHSDDRAALYACATPAGFLVERPISNLCGRLARKALKPCLGLTPVYTLMKSRDGVGAACSCAIKICPFALQSKSKTVDRAAASRAYLILNTPQTPRPPSLAVPTPPHKRPSSAPQSDTSRSAGHTFVPAGPTAGAARAA